MPISINVLTILIIIISLTIICIHFGYLFKYFHQCYRINVGTYTCLFALVFVGIITKHHSTDFDEIITIEI